MARPMVPAMASSSRSGAAGRPRCLQGLGRVLAGQPTASAAGLDLVIHSDLRAVRALWQVFEAHAVLTPFQTWAWAAAWWSMIEPRGGRSLVVALGCEKGELKLILPLAIEGRLGFRALVWLGQEVSDYNAPVIDRRLLERLTANQAGDILRAIARTLGGIDCLRLEKQPERLAGLPNPFSDCAAHDFTCRAHIAHLNSSWDDFVTGRRSGKSLRRLREKEKSLAKRGDISIEAVADLRERAAVVARLTAWKSAQLAASGTRNPFHDGDLCRFLAAAATAPELTQRLRVHVLKVGGELVAGTIGIVHRRSYVYYVAAYDGHGFARYSPGAILLLHLLRKCHAEGFEVFDFSNGDEGYKSDWCDTSMRLTVTLVPLTVSGHAVVSARRRWLDLVREVKSRPQLFDGLRSITSRLRALRNLFAGLGF